MSKIAFGLYALIMSALITFAVGLLIGAETNQGWAREVVVSFVEAAE